MFEFDEHYDELEAMENELALSQSENRSILPAWMYVGNDVWRLDFNVDMIETSQEWRLQTVDVA